MRALQASTDPARRVLRGDVLERWLQDSQNIRAWDDLYRRCPRATPFQSSTFFRVWVRHYGDQWDPLLVIESTPEGGLAALMPLAAGDGLITGAGAHQAEYQGWLTDEFRVEAFVTAALKQLLRLYPGFAIRIRYLNATSGLVRQLPRFGRMRLLCHPRPLLRLVDDDLQGALRKKSNRSRVKRLQRQGDLRVETVSDPKRLEDLLDQVAALYDFNQGARNDCLPFHDDARKRGFHLDWMREGGDQIRLTCMWVDDELVAAYLGVNDAEQSHLAILTFSPMHARHSPGKIHLYMCARKLADEGLAWLDLTPGGDAWKERFATDHDTVYELFVHATVGQAWKTRIVEGMISAVRSGLRAVGADPARVRQWGGVIRPDSKEVTGDSGYQVYRLEAAAGPAGTGRYGVNALSDLVLYRAAGLDRSRQAFLAEASSRLASGDTVFTGVQGGSLNLCAWLSRNGGEAGFTIPGPGPVLQVEIAADGRGALPGLLDQALAMLDERETPVYLVVPSANADLCAWAGQNGLQPVADMIPAVHQQGKGGLAATTSSAGPV